MRTKFSKRIDDVSIMGYKDNSPYKDELMLRIKTPNGRITMKGVSQELLAIGDGGDMRIMKPNKEYYFPNSKEVLEIPIKHLDKVLGGKAIKSLEDMIEDLACGGKMKVRRLTKFSSGGLLGNISNNPIVEFDKMNNKAKQGLINKLDRGSVAKGEVTEDNADAVLDWYNKNMQMTDTISEGIKSVGSALDAVIPGAGLVGNVLGGVISGGTKLLTNWAYGDKIKRAKDLQLYKQALSLSRQRELQAKNAMFYV